MKDGERNGPLPTTPSGNDDDDDDDDDIAIVCTATFTEMLAMDISNVCAGHGELVFVWVGSAI